MWKLGVVGSMLTVASSCVKSEPRIGSKCYALALSGGGDHVAYVAGVVNGLVTRLAMEHNYDASQWSVVTGTSTGALLASIAGSFDIGNEFEMAQAMIGVVAGELINTPGPARVSMPWSSGTNVSQESGLLNTSVLVSTLTEIFRGRALGNRMFSISATDDNTGDLVLWEEGSFLDSDQCLDTQKLVHRTRAAMAQAGEDETVSIDGQVFSSGSIILGADVFSAVLKCREAGFADADIVVDVVSSNSASLTGWNASIDNVTLELGRRGQEITQYTQTMQDLFDACDAFQDVSWRYFVQPAVALPSTGTAYNQTTMLQMVEMGVEDAMLSPIGQHCSIAQAARHSNRKQRMPPLSAERWDETAEKCYAMALSGGGAKGAFEAGVIKALVDRLNSTERQWQIFTGISAGSILTAGASLFDIGEESEMADFIIASMMNFTNTNSTVGNVYVDWPEAAFQLNESGYFNTTPLFDTLTRMLSTRPLGNRKFTIGATVDATGDLDLFDESMVVDSETGSLNVEKLATYVRASSAIPGFFQSVGVNGKVHSDGGVVMGTNVFSAVNRCAALGYKQHDIVLDLITCNADRLTPWNATSENIHSLVHARAGEIQKFSMAMADIFDACRAYPEVDWRFYVQAPPGLPSAAEFETAALQKMKQIGLDAGANATPGVHCSQAEHYRKHKMVEQARAKLLRMPVMV